MQVTEAAVAVIESMRSDAGVPDEAGLRFQATTGQDGQPAIGLAFAPEPVPGDQVTEQSGIKVFVEEELTQALSGAVLDAKATDEGEALFVRR